MPGTDQRQAKLHQWLQGQLNSSYDCLEIAGDASFRRYYRVTTSVKSYVVMDAPPDQESCTEFIDVTERLLAANLHAPQIHSRDLELGFLLLEDLGDQLYKDVMSAGEDPAAYDPIFVALQQLAQNVCTDDLPEYDRQRLQTELDLFVDWYAPVHCRIPLTGQEQQAWADISRHLISSALTQPQVFVHRDFHSCNVLLTAENSPGIIDYQDAVHGPITYDLISWILDRYIRWPRTQVIGWYEQHRQRVAGSVPADQWLRWCDWMGLQRNLKVLGIFARLAHRDGKPQYIDLMPAFYHYIYETAGLYPETMCLVTMLKQRPCVR